jgi:hypothetical protein
MDGHGVARVARASGAAGMSWKDKIPGRGSEKMLFRLPVPIPPIGPEPTATPADILHGLEYARNDDPQKSADLLDSQDYDGVVRLLVDADKTAGEWNNLGCAYAWLAIYEKDPVSLWLKAADALRKSSAADAARATSNLELLAMASGGIVVPDRS